jgi:hypothetical protein
MAGEATAGDYRKSLNSYEVAGFSLVEADRVVM